MKKQEFLDRLKSRISILDDEEVEDILTEYETHINEKMNAGKTEEQAIADFGDFNELIKDILAAYKIKDKGQTSSSSTSEFQAWIHKAIDEITNFMRPLIEKVNTLEGDQVGYFIGYIILTLVMVALIGIPFWFLERIGVALLSVIPLGVGHVFGVIFSVVLDIAQLVVCILIIIYGVQRAIEAATLKKPVDFGFVVKTSNGTTESKVKTETKVEPKVEKEDKTEVKVEVKSAPVVEPSVNVKIDEKTPVKKERVILPFIGNFFVLLFKGFVLVCMLPGFMMVLGLMIVLGILIALLTKGVYFIGLFMIIIGILSFTTTILDIIYRTVFRKKVSHA
jgi:uncharacterized membrane protein